MLFFKKEKVKKRVVCPISVLIDIMQETLDNDAGVQYNTPIEGETK